MARLRITVPDELTLEFTCANYTKVRARALAFVGAAEKLKAKCRVDRANAQLDFSPDDEGDGWEPKPLDGDFEGFFFDNAEYNVYAKLCGSGRKKLVVKSRFAVDEGYKKFASFEGGRVRSGTLNFENDVGKFDFTLQYEADGGGVRTLTFTSEVLSQKLDSRADWKTMIDDVEKRYTMLAADYLRQTYHSFDRKRLCGDTPNLIWWNLFAAEQEHLFRGVKTILERPRKRLQGVTEYRRADQLRTLTHGQENAFMEFRRDPSHRYRVEYDTSSNDTPENRFVKHALKSIGRKYSELVELICRKNQFGSRLSESEKDRMRGVEAKFRKCLAHPFFKGVGRFDGLKQLSLTLQNAPGYATVMRVYAILRASYMFYDGMKRLETKSIADLYEIWCFLKVEEIVKRSCKNCYGEHFMEPEANHGELSGKFVKLLGTGAKSQIVFKVRDPSGREDIELARVVYNPKVVDSDVGGDNGLPDTIYPTALTGKKGQIPDIVMQLRRDSMNRDESLRLTYLFDAKYRVEDAEGEGDEITMRPPQDAIDQMHRYRDAIYYAKNADDTILDPAEIKREVIGGYVLFPGKCAGFLEKPQGGNDDRPKYFRSIDQVNIGAIPLRPNNNNEYGHLLKFIEKLLLESPTLEAALDRINPQHGEILDNSTQEGIGDELLCGTYVADEMAWVQKGYYDLPKSTALSIGLGSLAEAQNKRILVLISARGYLKPIGSPYKILGCREISQEDISVFRAENGYGRVPSHAEGYYQFVVKPLVEGMKDVRDRLKIVTLEKDGVCKGVVDAAAELGIVCETAANLVSAAPGCDGFVVFDDSWVVPPSLRQVVQSAQKMMKSHQPNAMNVKRKKTRKALVQWLRILLRQVTPPRKYVLYIDGRDDDQKLAALSKQLLLDVLNVV
ncbi:MAG: restriction endonuclease-like protein [Kiritimatiellae bacterium]|nr:restriction endonuclease-like protein [Kiritimatiellia bacterium]